jgi:hypothetical protein
MDLVGSDEGVSSGNGFLGLSGPLDEPYEV